MMMCPVVIGVVPVEVAAGGRIAALLELQGKSLLTRAVSCLRDSGAVSEIVVALVGEVPLAAADGFGPADQVARPPWLVRLAETADPVPLRLVLGQPLTGATSRGPDASGPAAPTGIGAQAASGTDDFYLEHSPRYALAPAGLAAEVVARMRERPGLAELTPVRPMADSLRAVTADGLISSTPDRERYLAGCTPRALRPGGTTRGILPAPVARFPIEAPLDDPDVFQMATAALGAYAAD